VPDVANRPILGRADLGNRLSPEGSTDPRPTRAAFLPSCAPASVPHNSTGPSLEFWQRRATRCLSEEDARQVRENLCGFFRILAEWDRREYVVPAPDLRDPPPLKSAPSRRGRR